MAKVEGDNKDNSNLRGTEKNDIIYGYGGKDTLTGLSGNDTLVGGAGDDILTGDEGKDTFVLYYSGGGIDRITDFSVKDDWIYPTSAPDKSLDGSNVTKGVGVNFTESATDVLTLGGSNFGRLEPPEKYWSYNAADGALFYLGCQIAWLPPNLSPNEVIAKVV